MSINKALTWWRSLTGPQKRKYCGDNPLKRYKFYYEDEKKHAFIIYASNHNQAYDLAYESYGPQVENMLYKIEPKRHQTTTNKNRTK